MGLASAQCGLGEASLLALAGVCDSHHNTKNCIMCFASGMGLAGGFGFLWKFVWNDWLKFTLEQTLWIATLLSLVYTMTYIKNLWDVDLLKVAPQEKVVVLAVAKGMAGLGLVINNKDDSVQEADDNSLMDADDLGISCTVSSGHDILGVTAVGWKLLSVHDSSLCSLHRQILLAGWYMVSDWLSGHECQGLR